MTENKRRENVGGHLKVPQPRSEPAITERRHE